MKEEITERRKTRHLRVSNDQNIGNRCFDYPLVIQEDRFISTICTIYLLIK